MTQPATPCARPHSLLKRPLHWVNYRSPAPANTQEVTHDRPNGLPAPCCRRRRRESLAAPAKPLPGLYMPAMAIPPATPQADRPRLPRTWRRRDGIARRRAAMPCGGGAGKVATDNRDQNPACGIRHYPPDSHYSYLKPPGGDYTTETRRRQMRPECMRRKRHIRAPRTSAPKTHTVEGQSERNRFMSSRLTPSSGNVSRGRTTSSVRESTFHSLTDHGGLKL